jgi:hypothetical protein
MTDNQLIKLIRTTLSAGLLQQNIDYPIIQKRMPNQQGTNSLPTIYIEKLFDTSRGIPTKSFVYDEINDVFDEVNTQFIETTIQISAIVTQNPSDTSIPTASDVANLCKNIIFSNWFVEQTLKQNVNILNVTQIRNPYFENDRNRNESNANFDAIFTHVRTVAFKTPKIDFINSGTYPI